MLSFRKENVKRIVRERGEWILTLTIEFILGKIKNNNVILYFKFIFPKLDFQIIKSL